MKPERWQQLDELFQSALERESVEREMFLDEACAGNDELRQQVDALLAALGVPDPDEDAAQADATRAASAAAAATDQAAAAAHAARLLDSRAAAYRALNQL